MANSGDPSAPDAESSDAHSHHDPERERLRAANQGVPWRQWGPYLADRMWGTVREDYSADGSAWDFFPYDHALHRSYRWGEDGLFGICDNRSLLCLALALWNGNDATIKERLFGLSGSEGNHHEDVKEYYFYTDNTPVHSYMKAVYKYPQLAFPYEQLRHQNRERDRRVAEYELLDTGIFDQDRYFDVEVEYAKAAPDDIVMRITAHNRGPKDADIHLLPTVWFRNTWAWGRDERKPYLKATSANTILLEHDELGDHEVVFDGSPELLFTENESNARLIWGAENRTPFVKDGINDAVVYGKTAAVNPARSGTKAAAHYHLHVPSMGSVSVTARLWAVRRVDSRPSNAMVLEARRADADAFYAPLVSHLDGDQQLVVRQALAGLLWSKQHYEFDVDQWLTGDPTGPPPPPGRAHRRNHLWRYLRQSDILLMPDTWEYPWYASWDLAFHAVPMALIDPMFAKQQLLALVEPRTMRANGQIPSYEWAFEHATPPVQAWATWQVYTIDKRCSGQSDLAFLERMFERLAINYAWWVGAETRDNTWLFNGGFLGLDNIGVIDRGAPLPTGGHLHQADGTAWMACFAAHLVRIALELAIDKPHYAAAAVRYTEEFFEMHLAASGDARSGAGLWDASEQFFVDVIHLHTGGAIPLAVRSLVGLLPLVATVALPADVVRSAHTYERAVDDVLTQRPQLRSAASGWTIPGEQGARLLTLTDAIRLAPLLQAMRDPAEFWSEHGIRSMSKRHDRNPYILRVSDQPYPLEYAPRESTDGPFGENSNWRGPVWMPMNYALWTALDELRAYHGDYWTPTGRASDTLPMLRADLARNLYSLFLLDSNGHRPVYNQHVRWQQDPHWRDYVLFYEYFHAETGEGLGASHQTGWTALVALLFDGVNG